MTKAEFLARVERQAPKSASAAQTLLKWTEAARGLRSQISNDETHATFLGILKMGVTERRLLQLESQGIVWVIFDELRNRYPDLSGDGKRAFEVAVRLRLSGVGGSRSQQADWGTKASWRLEETDLAAFTAALDWVVSEHEKAQIALLGRRGR